MAIADGSCESRSERDRRIALSDQLCLWIRYLDDLLVGLICYENISPAIDGKVQVARTQTRGNLRLLRGSQCAVDERNDIDIAGVSDIEISDAINGDASRRRQAAANYFARWSGSVVPAGYFSMAFRAASATYVLP